MVDNSGTELAEELLSTKSLEVVDGMRPEMKDVVTRKTVSLFHDDDAGA